jgi:23S rRNA pseudouridine1911/1915/1917 synthase
MAHIGHPVIADPVYGSGFAASARRLCKSMRAAVEALDRQALHASHLGFEHPVTGRRLAFDSPLPADLAALRHGFAPIADKFASKRVIRGPDKGSAR